MLEEVWAEQEEQQEKSFTGRNVVRCIPKSRIFNLCDGGKGHPGKKLPGDTRNPLKVDPLKSLENFRQASGFRNSPNRVYEPTLS